MHIETGGPVAAGAAGDLKEFNWQEVLLRMEIDKFRMVLEGVSIQEKLAVDFNKDVRSLRDNRSSRRFFMDRCSDKGVPEKTWKCFTENPEAAEDLMDEEDATAAEEKKQSEMREQDIGEQSPRNVSQSESHGSVRKENQGEGRTRPSLHLP
mmetsp:Transcript_13409/g.21475  ORF Transcript_13409/g.21475 Transcript_13409/m.21475 type:complete len:152 (+) Transcript_13409:168-623(+)